MIDPQDRRGAPLFFEFAPELLFNSFKKRNGATWVRCFGRAARWLASRLSAGPATGTLASDELIHARRAETHRKIPGAFEPRCIQNRSMDIARRNALKLLRKLRHCHVLACHQPRQHWILVPGVFSIRGRALFGSRAAGGVAFRS